jgi:serine/threonine-protein kinase RsbT
MEARRTGPPQPDERTLLAVLGKYVGPGRAPGILARARRESPHKPLVARISDALRGVIGEYELRSASRELMPLFVDPPPKLIEIELRYESDIARARLAARDLCTALSTTPLILQKLATIVSELARNMVSYAGGGQLSLRKADGERRTVVIAARDHGPGIKNLEEILAGKYKSRSGLGLGILGTKRLADRFTIQSSSAGTHVDVEVNY